MSEFFLLYLTVFLFPHDASAGQDLEARPRHGGHALSCRLGVATPAAPALDAVVIQAAQAVQQVNQSTANQTPLFRPAEEKQQCTSPQQIKQRSSDLKEKNNNVPVHSELNTALQN